MVDVRGLNRLKSSIDAEDKISKIDPVVIIPEALGLDDTDQSTSDDCSKLGVRIAS